MLHTCLGLSHLPHVALLACACRCTDASAPPMCRYWPLRCRDKPPADKTMVAHRRLHSSHALPRHEPSHRACLDSFAPRHLARAHPCVATMALHHNHPRPNKPHTDNSHSLASGSRYHCHCQVLPWLQRADTAQASHLVPRLHGYKTPPGSAICPPNHPRSSAIAPWHTLCVLSPRLGEHHACSTWRSAASRGPAQLLVGQASESRIVSSWAMRHLLG
jgi:hypothetical protein